MSEYSPTCRPTAAARMASSFGGGLGRLREICGTVSGAALVLGIARGYSDPKDYAAKKAHYALVQEFARRFREANGSIVCRELLSFLFELEEREHYNTDDVIEKIKSM